MTDISEQYEIRKLKRSYASGGRCEHIYNALWFDGVLPGGRVLGKCYTQKEAEKLISNHIEQRLNPTLDNGDY